MRTIAWLTGIGTALAAAVYMVVSLNRWEWNRALFFGLIVLIAEVGMATGLVLRRLTRLERANREVLDPMLREILRANRPARQDRFAWLRESTSQMNVFITFLVGGGIVAETGSVLSHLAILAREAGVATVVGYAGARTELAEGDIVEVDGATGCVTVQEGATVPSTAGPDEEAAP